MAANIVGTVFTDLTENGIDAVDPRLSGVPIALFRDGGNGTFDGGSGDDIAAGTTASAATTGLYSFSVATAGTYFVVQTSPVSGLLQRSLQQVQTVVINSVDLVGLSSLTIDTFNTTSQSISASFPGSTPASSAVSAPEAIGGERDLFADASAGNVSINANQPATGLIAFELSAGSNGARTLTYDGIDQDALSLSTNGLGGVDLTSAGQALGFRFNVGSDIAGSTMGIQINSGSNASSNAVVIPVSVGGFPDQILEVPFSSFSITAGTGADFAAVGSIRLSFASADSADIGLDLIETYSPTTKIVNFANLIPMSIGNLVFVDQNNNGLLNASSPTEVGLNNLTLQLFSDTNSNGVFNPGIDLPTVDRSNAIITTTTSNAGVYRFINLFPGSYFVVIPASQFAASSAAFGHVVSSTIPTGQFNSSNRGAAISGGGGGVVSTLISLEAGSAPVNDGDTDANSNNSIDIGLVPQVDLRITKTTSSTTALTGGRITYTIVAANDGPATASEVSIVDNIPDGLRVLSVTSSSTTDIINLPASAQDTLPQNLDDIQIFVGTQSPGNARFITIIAEVLPIITGTGSPGILTNSAVVTSIGSELLPTNNSATVTTPIQLLSDLSITKTNNLSGPVIVGTTITYTLTARNDGPSRATSVQVTDNLPDGIQIISVSSSDPAIPISIPPSAQDFVPGNNDDLVFNIPNLGVGTPNQKTFSIVAKFLPSTFGPVTNLAQILSTDTIDPDLRNNTDSVSDFVNLRFDLGIVKSGPANTTVGSTITYSMTAINDGPNNAFAVFVEDKLPDGIQVLAATMNGAPVSIPASASDSNFSNPDKILFDVQNLAAGATNSTLRVVAVVLPSASSLLVNTATIDINNNFPESDSNRSNNTSSVTTNVLPLFDVGVMKNAPALLQAGDILNYTILVTNNGPSVATSIFVQDNLPIGLTFVSGTSMIGTNVTGTVVVSTNNSVSSTIPSLLPGQSALVTIRTIVSMNSSDLIVNTVTITAPGDSNTTNNIATATTQVTRSLPKNNSISGYVYADVDNDGNRFVTLGGSRIAQTGIPNVLIQLTNSSTRATLQTRTDPDGYYQFVNLVDGEYDVSEFQPINFIDGKETAGTPSLSALGGVLSQDQFTRLSLRGGVIASEYNFGEFGLDPKVANKSLLLASTPNASALANMFSTGGLAKFVAPVAGRLFLDSPNQSSSIQIVSAQSLQTLVAAMSGSLSYDLGEGETVLIAVNEPINRITSYFSSDSLSDIISPGEMTNPSRVADTDGDSNVSPLDALLLINIINSEGVHALKRGSFSTFVDPSRDGWISPIDVLMVINDLNRQKSYAPAIDGEGEGGQDLVAFSKALAQSGVRFFGADWSQSCKEQKELFEDGMVYLPFVEVTNPDRTRNTTAIQENVTIYPTWEFANGTRVTGVQSLAQLASLSGVDIPTGIQPSFVEIPNQNVLSKSPLHVPVDAYDPNGSPLTISVTSSDPSIIFAEMVSNPKSMRMAVNGYGDMLYRLFADEAPRPVERIEALMSSGFYDQTFTNRITFHRVIDRFVIQTGDPTGTGAGGSTLGRFDDQFNLNLQHNRSGVLSYAKVTDDTNDSQFFITEGPQRHLDFTHSVFGQLVEGEIVREAISRTAVTNNKPNMDVSIQKMEIFSDTENGLIRLKAIGTSGTATITVTARDSAGQSFIRTFTASASADIANGGPFLNPVTVPTLAPGQTVSVQLTSQDKEGDAVYYDATKQGNVPYSFTIDHNTGSLSVTAPQNFTGTFQLSVGVRPATTSSTYDLFDRQVITFRVSNGPDARDDSVTTPFTQSIVIDILANDVSADSTIAPDSVTIVSLPTEGTVQILSGGRIQFSHSIISAKDISFRYLVADSRGILSNPSTVTVAVRSAFQNQRSSLDVDDDLGVSPLDVLAIVNDINRSGSRLLPTNVSKTAPFVDVDGDGSLSPLDVLMVVNFLNSRPALGEGESSSILESTTIASDCVDKAMASLDDYLGTIFVEDNDNSNSKYIGRATKRR